MVHTFSLFSPTGGGHKPASIASGIEVEDVYLEAFSLSALGDIGSAYREAGVG